MREANSMGKLGIKYDNISKIKNQKINNKIQWT